MVLALVVHVLLLGQNHDHDVLMAGVSRNYTNYMVTDGCFTIGNNLIQRTNQLRLFPLSSIQWCSKGIRCTGFQIYVRPESTLYTVYIEYKTDCTVLPEVVCNPPLGQQPGGQWYAFRSTVRCANLRSAANVSNSSITGTMPATNDITSLSCTDTKSWCTDMSASSDKEERCAKLRVRRSCPATCNACIDAQALANSPASQMGPVDGTAVADALTFSAVKYHARLWILGVGCMAVTAIAAMRARTSRLRHFVRPPPMGDDSATQTATKAMPALL
mmetsp:Transcript_10710/g.27839  ORF Transcript_10710/g.27839 Transcript_10710/m.27839 type:complete len:274 (+) Transcript_10710:130-951(+)